MPYSKQKTNDKMRHGVVPAEEEQVNYFMRTMAVSRMQIIHAIKTVGSNREKLIQYLRVQLYGCMYSA